jgi:putative ABC transport system substrate-binding protein
MRRREFIEILGGAAVLPVSGRAQQPDRIRRIGVLLPGTPAATAHLLAGLRQGLREHGYAENRTILLELRHGEGRMERLAGLAKELVDLEVDAIVTATDAGVQAVRTATERIPIVMANSTDPVGTGFVASLARPGGNITGLTYNSTEITGKRLELLKEVVPELARIAFLWTPQFRGNALDHQEIQAAGSALRVEVHSAAARDAGELDSALSAAARERLGALVIAGQNPVTFVNRKRIVEFAAAHRLPSMSYVREFVDDGGLISYGPNNPDLFRRAAGYVDKILRGAKPADLPVEQPTKFELVVNLKTAKALGITIPQSILFLANEVIE